jgi:hypothetical protein
MLTLDEKIKILEEKLSNLEKSIKSINVPEERNGHRHQVLLFISRQMGAKNYFNAILATLKNQIDQV